MRIMLLSILLIKISFSSQPVHIMMVNDMDCPTCTEIARVINDYAESNPEKVIVTQPHYGWQHRDPTKFGDSSTDWLRKHWGSYHDTLFDFGNTEVLPTRVPVVGGSHFIDGDALIKEAFPRSNSDHPQFLTLVKDSVEFIVDSIYNVPKEVELDIKVGKISAKRFDFFVGVTASEKFNVNRELELFAFIQTDKVDYVGDYHPDYYRKTAPGAVLANVLRTMLPQPIIDSTSYIRGVWDPATNTSRDTSVIHYESEGKGLEVSPIVNSVKKEFVLNYNERYLGETFVPLLDYDRLNQNIVVVLVDKKMNEVVASKMLKKFASSPVTTNLKTLTKQKLTFTNGSIFIPSSVKNGILKIYNSKGMLLQKSVVSKNQDMTPLLSDLGKGVFLMKIFSDKVNIKQWIAL